MAKRILIRRDITANWESVNPILSNGEFGIEIQADGTRRVKLGTGSVPWNSLDYFLDNPGLVTAFQNHENDKSAHGASATPAANLIAMYNSNSGLKSNKVPSEANDAVRKTELDTVNADITDLQNDLADETGRAETAENTIASDLTQEALRAQGAEGTLTNSLASEVTNRTNADSDLQDSIDTLEAGLAAEITNRQSAVSTAVSTAASDATNKANTAENNAKEYADDLSLATQKWLSAVNTFDDLLTPPPNPDQTYLCRVITGDNYGVYQWIGGGSSWTYFSDNLDFIDRIADPVTDNIPVITANGELADGGESITGILDTISTGLAAKENTITAGTSGQYYRGDKTWQTFPSINDGILTLQKNGSDIDTFSANAGADKTINITMAKGDVGLSNVDNTADADKPISTAAQTALNGKVDKTDYYIYRPDLWPLNTEIDFGQGLFGKRFSGTFTGTSVLSIGMGIAGTTPATFKVVNMGGWAVLNSETNGGFAFGHGEIYVVGDNTYNQVLRIDSTSTRTNAPYDVWVTYRK